MLKVALTRLTIVQQNSRFHGSIVPAWSCGDRLHGPRRRNLIRQEKPVNSRIPRAGNPTDVVTSLCVASQARATLCNAPSSEPCVGVHSTSRKSLSEGRFSATLEWARLASARLLELYRLYSRKWCSWCASWIAQTPASGRQRASSSPAALDLCSRESETSRVSGSVGRIPQSGHQHSQDA